MQTYQRDFIEFALAHDVLRFGEFTLKSGRLSPYFFNAGLFNTGLALAKLGYFYAATIQHNDPNYSLLFGPAYKGIPLVTATSVALAEHFAIDKPICFDRKEVKDHGEGGLYVGAPMQGDVLLIDDVISAGVTFRHAKTQIEAAGAKLTGVVISLDRQERGTGDRSAIAEIEQTYQVPVYPIITLSDIIEYLTEEQQSAKLAAIQAYNAEYGSR